MQFTITHWGCTPSGDSIYLFRLTNATGASIELTNLGATWVSANMPNRYDVFENILLGYDHAEGYLKDTYYMGATVGRFANRIHLGSVCNNKGSPANTQPLPLPQNTFSPFFSFFGMYLLSR